MHNNKYQNEPSSQLALFQEGAQVIELQKDDSTYSEDAIVVGDVLAEFQDNGGFFDEDKNIAYKSVVVMHEEPAFLSTYPYANETEFDKSSDKTLIIVDPRIDISPLDVVRNIEPGSLQKKIFLFPKEAQVLTEDGLGNELDINVELASLYQEFKGSSHVAEEGVKRGLFRRLKERRFAKQVSKLLDKPGHYEEQDSPYTTEPVAGKSIKDEVQTYIPRDEYSEKVELKRHQDAERGKELRLLAQTWLAKDSSEREDDLARLIHNTGDYGELSPEQVARRIIVDLQSSSLTDKRRARLERSLGSRLETLNLKA